MSGRQSHQLREWAPGCAQVRPFAQRRWNEKEGCRRDRESSEVVGRGGSGGLGTDSRDSRAGQWPGHRISEREESGQIPGLLPWAVTW